MKKGLKLLLLADTWATLALGLIGPIYALFVEEIGGDILDASWSYFAFMFTTGFVMYLVGHWEDKIHHKEKLVVLGYSLTTVGCFSYIFVSDQTSLIVTQIILGVASALCVPAFDALYSDLLDKEREASEWSFEEAMIYMVTAIASVAGGYIANIYSFRFLFFIMFLISLMSVITSAFLLSHSDYPSNTDRMRR